MSTLVRIPQPLRKLTQNRAEVEISARTVGEALNQLEQEYPGLRDRICDESGEVRQFINVFLDGEDIRFLQGLGTPIADGSELSIIPAIAGGSQERER
ncbi:MAG: MoaD/ThiS family protein [Acidobacteria bacterium]|nr:MoaD/ThiS family protein [Acidobacteriota bacterium]